ncbi:MAG: YdeI family protein [Prolixibacteraceae bacterium]
MNTIVDVYFTEGCGRCPFGGTPRCKVNNWSEELQLLRKIVLDCGLNEESKWGVPCYTFKKRNIVIVSAFKEYCALSFFKGALLNDAKGILVQQTENVQAARQIRFINIQKILDLEPILKAYVFEAVEVEKTGLKIPLKEQEKLEYPEEFQHKLDEIPFLKSAFEALTPGRQRGYLYYFSQAKQSRTRESRIEKCIPQILVGKGINDR